MAGLVQGLNAALFDTNILIDYTKGVESAYKLLHTTRYYFISVITRIEVLAGIKTAEEERRTRHFLQVFTTLDLNAEITELAIQLRRQHRKKLPDTIIWATARSLDLLFITRNTKDFPEGTAGVHVPYTLT